MTDKKRLQVLGSRIRELRHEQDWSQEHLAELAGIHVNHLRRVERGEANPTYLVLLRIAAALEVGLVDLVP